MAMYFTSNWVLLIITKYTINQWGRVITVSSFNKIYDKIISKKTGVKVPKTLTSARWPVRITPKEIDVVHIGCKSFTREDLKQIKKILKSL